MNPRKRDREFKQFPQELRNKVVYSYLFNGLSHRELDEVVLEQDSEYSRGYLSMGILHYLGLEGVHKGLFREMSPNDALQSLKDHGTSFDTVYQCVRHHVDAMFEQDTILQDLESENVEDGHMPNKYDGGIKFYYGKRYERDAENRRRAIEVHGVVCKVCGFNFEKVYGERGKNFIEVHHVRPLSTLQGEAVMIDPVTDLVPLCANCHRMVHRRHDDVLTVEQLRDMVSSRVLQD